MFLEAFEGPLDLLLYLIRRQNLDILDIPLAEITRQYMQYIELMQDLQLELAGEYMVMAATLAEIKSRMLLPRPKLEPRTARRIRAPSSCAACRSTSASSAPPKASIRCRASSATSGRRAPSSRTARSCALLPQITLQEMLLAFKDVVVRSEMFAHHHVQRERLSVRERMSDILAAPRAGELPVEFMQLFRPEEGRMGVTVTFVAILELMREGLIDIVQAEPYAPLHVRAASRPA